MKKRFRYFTSSLLLTALLLSGSACRGPSNDGTDTLADSATGAVTDQTTEAPTGGETTAPPPPVQLDESTILASAVEAWDLSDGGTGGTAQTANGGTNATHRYGVWLKNNTFGYALDFSTEGSYALAENSQFKLGEQFAISAWVKAPIRDGDERVIISQGAPSTSRYDNITVFDNMDARTSANGRWSSDDGLVFITENAPEGKAYLQATQADEGTLIISKRIHPTMDISSYAEGGYLHLRMRIDGLANVKDGQIEFTSSGECDKNEFQFSSVCVKEDGVWTEVYLPFSNGGHSGGYADLTAINYFRLYINTTGPVTLMIDDVYFCDRITEPAAEGWKMFINEAGELDFTVVGIEGLTSSGKKLDDGLWHHTLVSSDGATLSYYVDGEAVKSVPFNGTPTVSNTNLYIGSTADFDKHLDGSMAELRIFDAPKTPGEVTATKLDVTDNEAKKPVMDMKQGIVLDRRQYYGSDSREIEPGAVVGYDDITAIINMGFDHVKLLLTPNHLIAEDGSLKEEEMEYITWVLGHVTSQDFRAILCIHPESPFKETYLADLNQFELLCKWYGELAAYIGEHWTPDQVALQLMTEPFANSSEVSWSYMSDRMWGAVRNVLPEHTILTSSAMTGNLEGLKSMSPASDDNLIYTFTTYEPYAAGFSTFQTPNAPLWAYIKDVPYPIEEGVDYTEIIEHCIEDVPNHYQQQAREWLTEYVNGISDNLTNMNRYNSLYNAEWHMLRAKSLDDWRQKYGGNIHIMCVEFGCMYSEWPKAVYGAQANGISTESRYQLVKDMRTSFEAYNIGWSYWSYNEAFTIFLPEYALALRGQFPNAETIAKIIDYRMLEDSLGVAPKVKNEPSISLDGVVGAWNLADTEGKIASSELPFGHEGKYFGTASEAYGDSYATVFDGKNSYVLVENTGFNFNGAFTLSADIKTSGKGSVQTILAQLEDKNSLYTIDSFDTVNGMWGMTPITQGQLTKPAEGTGYAESVDSSLIVFCRAWNVPHNLSAYETDGILRMAVYVEDAAKLNGACMLELNSSNGTSSWKLPTLQTGWNHIELNMADYTTNAADLSAIRSFRVYQYVTEQTTLGIDALTVGFKPDAVIDSDWQLALNERGELTFMSNKLTLTAPTTKALNDGKWHKILVSYDGSTLTFYADGQKLASVKASGLQNGASGESDLYIGAAGIGKDAFSGSLAHVVVCDTVKTPAE